MPGRSRTGSRPSRTVMSLAVYVALVMKKALQLTHFRADSSVSNRAAVSGPGEARARSIFYRFAQIVRLDRRGPIPRLPRLLRRGLRQRLGMARLGRRQRLRKAARDEAETARSRLAENLSQPSGDLALELLELERPGRRAGVHVQRPVPRQTGGPGVARHSLDDRLGPAAHEIGHRSRAAKATELAANGFADAIHQAAATVLVPSPACATSSVCAGSPGNELRLALVTSAWPPARRRSARIRRRSGSSSESTSSSRSSGLTPRRSSNSSASPSKSASTARRCSP